MSVGVLYSTYYLLDADDQRQRYDLRKNGLNQFAYVHVPPEGAAS